MSVLAPWLVASLFALLALAAAGWTVRHRQRLRDLEQRCQLVEQLAGDRQAQLDVAQEELFRRLYEQRELEKEKIQLQAQMSEYEKCAALAQLALGAAHEINNPLLGILSHLELELNTASDENVRTEIEQCIAGARRISSTLRGLVNYARPAPPLLSRINLARLVADTLTFLETQPLLRDKRLHNTIPQNLPLVRADANQLSQVLMNVLLNAAEATPGGGRITVTAGKLTYVDSLEIQVTDTGCGIPADILPHVFEPFFSTKRGRGTGLGLSISQAYLRSHGGDIRVDSVPDHGTTVTITLPIRQGQESTVEESQLVV